MEQAGKALIDKVLGIMRAQGALVDRKRLENTDRNALMRLAGALTGPDKAGKRALAQGGRDRGAKGGAGHGGA